MQIDSLVYDGDEWAVSNAGIAQQDSAQLILVFSDTEALEQPRRLDELRNRYPNARLVGASTAGNVLGNEIAMESMVATVVAFEKSSIELSVLDFSPGDDAEILIPTLVDQLPKVGLRHVFILSDGLNVNGSALERGICNAALGVSVSGGLAGDGDRYQQTFVIVNDLAKSCRMVAIGFYGDALEISSSWGSGWSSFGADRLVTKSDANRVYELDGQPVLDLYEMYLGDFFKDLKRTGQRFPLSIRAKADDEEEVVRSYLDFDVESKSILFAGDVPQGYIARLMKSDMNALVIGAKGAASRIQPVNTEQSLGLVVSCVGRKRVMGQMVDEELEAVSSVLGDGALLTGFYSYGEVAPSREDCTVAKFFNQTMTLTLISEK